MSHAAIQTSCPWLSACGEACTDEPIAERHLLVGARLGHWPLGSLVTCHWDLGLLIGFGMQHAKAANPDRRMLPAMRKLLAS
jgi:hypothetical protein